MSAGRRPAVETDDPAGVGWRSVALQDRPAFLLERRNEPGAFAQQLGRDVLHPHLQQQLQRRLHPRQPRQVGRCRPRNAARPAEKPTSPAPQIRAAHIVPAVNLGQQFLLQRFAHIKNARAAGAQQPLVRARRQKIQMLDGNGKSAQRLDGVNTKEDVPLAQIRADGFQVRAGTPRGNGWLTAPPAAFVRPPGPSHPPGGFSPVRAHSAAAPARPFPPAPSRDRHWRDNRRSRSGYCRPCATAARRRRCSTPARSAPQKRSPPPAPRSGAPPVRASAGSAIAGTARPGSPPSTCVTKSLIAAATRRGRGLAAEWARKIFERATGKFVPAQFFVRMQFVNRHVRPRRLFYLTVFSKSLMALYVSLPGP